MTSTSVLTLKSLKALCQRISNNFDAYTNNLNNLDIKGMIAK